MLPEVFKIEISQLEYCRLLSLAPTYSLIRKKIRIKYFFYVSFIKVCDLVPRLLQTGGKM